MKKQHNPAPPEGAKPPPPPSPPAPMRWVQRPNDDGYGGDHAPGWTSRMEPVPVRDAHNDRYAVCPACAADGEFEGTLDNVAPAQPGGPAKLLELMHCPACKHRWWETWVYVGQEAIA